MSGNFMDCSVPKEVLLSRGASVLEARRQKCYRRASRQLLVSFKLVC